GGRKFPCWQRLGQLGWGLWPPMACRSRERDYHGVHDQYGPGGLHRQVSNARSRRRVRRTLLTEAKMALRIATWNINGIKARIELLLRWLEEEKPDIVGLQEIKSVDEGFPRAEIEALGYNVETHGQKSWNGVALLSKLPFDE